MGSLFLCHVNIKKQAHIHTLNRKDIFTSRDPVPTGPHTMTQAAQLCVCVCAHVCVEVGDELTERCIVTQVTGQSAHIPETAKPAGPPLLVPPSLHISIHRKVPVGEQTL